VQPADDTGAAQGQATLQDVHKPQVQDQRELGKEQEDHRKATQGLGYIQF
jgi:hypothetical protein